VSQAKRYRATKPFRDREACAREIARFLVNNDDPESLAARAERCERLLMGSTFNVADVRRHARRLVELEARAAANARLGRQAEAARLLGRARTGAKLLAMLGDQPDDCPACYGYGDADDLRCSDCEGTGSNLGGYLPEVEATPAVWRRIADSGFYRKDTDAGWLDDFSGIFHPSPSMHRPTRVAPRGEQETLDPYHLRFDWMLCKRHRKFRHGSDLCDLHRARDLPRRRRTEIERRFPGSSFL
jgi:hypothetical protein